MVRIGEEIPDFELDAYYDNDIDKIRFSNYRGKWLILVFYPADFTFVCPTEIIAFQEQIEEFEKRNVAVVGCSVDSEFSHWKWLQTERSDGGIKGVKYPLVADQAMTISENFDVLAGSWDYNEEGESVFEGIPQSYRGLFLIDKEGIVKHQLVNDMPLGRSIDEALRLVDALQFNEEHGEVCPANWKIGDKALKADQKGIAEYLSNR